LVFTVPGIPSLYYGSEAGLRATTGSDDWPVRPPLTPTEVAERGAHPDLISVVRRLAELRAELPELSVGGYRELAVDSLELAFVRRCGEHDIAVMVNGADTDAVMDIPLTGSGYDLLNQESIDLSVPVSVPPFWGRIIRLA
jgi:glycosidase